MITSSLTELTAVEAVNAMRTGTLKAEDYASALLKRAQELESLNAFRTIDRAAVMEASRIADKVRKAGKKLGLLHGLPIPVKDSINTKALYTSNGTRALHDFKPRHDAAVLKPLLAQGAIVMGKTNLHELSWGWTSNNAIFGAVHNPYDQTRIAGGSSGGSAAAVAARIAPIAIGEDTLGSIRIPASCCGVAGLRPTFGRYPGNGIMAITRNKFDQVGPLARSVADLALFDMAVTGGTKAVTPMPLKGVQIGISPEYLHADLDPEVNRVIQEALRKLRKAGVVIVKAELPEITHAASEIDFTIIFYETIKSFTEFLKKQRTGSTFDELFAQMSQSLQEVMQSCALPPNRPTKETYEAMLLKRNQLRRAIRRYFVEQKILALAFPTIMCPPPKIGEDTDVEINGQKVPVSVALVRNIAIGTCAGLASLVLPAGLTSAGLPVGLEFDALARRDRMLLSLGLSLEESLNSIPAPSRSEC